MRVTHSLVVGASGGLGRAVVAELQRRGVAVSAAGRRPPEGMSLRTFLPLEAASADWLRVYEEVEAAGGALDAVVFVAGTAALGRTALVPEAEARSVFELNFWAVARAATAASTLWTPPARRGSFLAVLSIAGRRAVPHESWYGASKAAAGRFLESLQLEHDPRRVRLQAAYPGLLRTGFRDAVPWFGAGAPPTSYGTEPAEAAGAFCDLLAGRRRARVIGWRERAIDLADRLAPGLYDRVLRRRLGGGPGRPD